MIRDFVQWTATLGETGELEQLRNCRVGIEAAEYLNQRILNHPRAKEPLVPALGGLPLALTQHIEDDLANFRTFDIEPYFVFSGLDITKQDDPFRQKIEEAAVNINAWTLYDSHEAEASVAKFGQSSTTTSERELYIMLTLLSIRHARRPLPRITVYPDRTQYSLDSCAIQRLGSGKHISDTCWQWLIVYSWHISRNTNTYTPSPDRQISSSSNAPKS
jgi:hypothetical protein